MALITADRVKDTATTTGTGVFTVSGTAPQGFRTFSAVCSVSDTVYYCIEHQTASEWETGLGTYSASNQLTRTTVQASSNGGSAVNFSAGTKNVFITVTNAQLSVIGAGLETIWLPAAAWTARTTNGAASGTTELATNDIMLKSFDFDQTTEEGIGIMVAMPKSWNEGTVTFAPYWTAASGSGGVVWGLAGIASSNDDPLDTAVSGQQTSTDTFILANDLHVGPTSSAITIGGTPAANDLVYLELTREVANASDTLTADAKFIGLHLFYTTNANTDD